MKSSAFLSTLFVSGTLLAEPQGELIFHDEFERSESQELKDEPGNNWTTSSDARAKGNKQVDLRNGAMYIYMHKEGDHAVSVRQEMSFRDGAIGMRFMLEHKDDKLQLNFTDLGEKTVHAGHLFNAIVAPGSVTLQDLKTGKMNQVIRAANKAKTLTGEQQELLKSKSKTFPTPISIGAWHDLLVEVQGNEATVSIDGRPVANWKAEAFAHPTKTMIRLLVPRQAVVDDVKIWRKR